MQADSPLPHTLENGFREWAHNERGLSPKTERDYTVAIRHAMCWAAARGETLADLRLIDLKAYLFSTKPTARSRNARRCALQAFWAYLVDSGQVPVNLAAQLPRLPERKLLPKPLPREVVPAILATAAIRGPREHALLAVYLFTGLRLSEVRGLRWPQVAHEWVCLVKKGGDERTVFLHDEVRAALAAWQAEAPESEWVFASERVPGQPFSASWFERTIKSVGLVAGVPNVRPHRLRHTFATALYEQTGDLGLVKQAMGHASIQSTEIYAEVVQQDVRIAVEKLRFGRERGGQS